MQKCTHGDISEILMHYITILTYLMVARRNINLILKMVKILGYSFKYTIVNCGPFYWVNWIEMWLIHVFFRVEKLFHDTSMISKTVLNRIYLELIDTLTNQFLTRIFKYLTLISAKLVKTIWLCLIDRFSNFGIEMLLHSNVMYISFIWIWKLN